MLGIFGRTAVKFIFELTIIGLDGLTIGVPPPQVVAAWTRGDSRQGKTPYIEIPSNAKIPEITWNQKWQVTGTLYKERKGFKKKEIKFFLYDATDENGKLGKGKPIWEASYDLGVCVNEGGEKEQVISLPVPIYKKTHPKANMRVIIRSWKKGLHSSDDNIHSEVSHMDVGSHDDKTHDDADFLDEDDELANTTPRSTKTPEISSHTLSPRDTISTPSTSTHNVDIVVSSNNSGNTNTNPITNDNTNTNLTFDTPPATTNVNTNTTIHTPVTTNMNTQNQDEIKIYQQKITQLQDENNKLTNQLRQVQESKNQDTKSNTQDKQLIKQLEDQIQKLNIDLKQYQENEITLKQQLKENQDINGKLSTDMKESKFLLYKYNTPYKSNNVWIHSHKYTHIF